MKIVTCEICGTSESDLVVGYCENCDRACCVDCVDWCYDEYDMDNGVWLCLDCQEQLTRH